MQTTLLAKCIWFKSRSVRLITRFYAETVSNYQTYYRFSKFSYCSLLTETNIYHYYTFMLLYTTENLSIGIFLLGNSLIN